MKPAITFWQLDNAAAALLLLLSLFGWRIAALRKGSFWTAFAITFLCVCSPLQVLSAHYLFSAHMLVHVLLLLLVGPLLVLSLPVDKKSFAAFFKLLQKYPVLGWLTGVGVMWFWHIPVLFNATMAGIHEGSFSWIPLFENLSLILAGVLFSAPVLHPRKAWRIDALPGVLYLFTACIGCSVLGILITFAPAGLYQHFLSGHDTLGLNQRILAAGIRQETDQQAAGLIMWVPCCLLYVTGAMYLLVQWFAHKESDTPVNSVEWK